MAYEVIILGHLHMPLYFIGTFTEYPKIYTGSSVQPISELHAQPKFYMKNKLIKPV